MTTQTAIKERPILFSGEMVRAILNGRKTQTRRVMKPQPYKPTGIFHLYKKLSWGAYALDPPNDMHFILQCSPCGKPGDRLWVRETWCVNFGTLIYRADYEPDSFEHGAKGWKPSIHMPRRFSRLTLEITDVRVERVRDISEVDCMAEGVRPDGRAGNEPHKYAFKRLWNEINASRGYGWDVNPWVWVVEFKRVQP